VVKQESTDGFLSRVYKNLFVTPSEQESLENEVRTEKILDRNDGIYSSAADKGFNLNMNGNIFSENTTIKEFKPANKSQNIKRPTRFSNYNIFNTEEINKSSFNKGELPPDMGNNLDKFS
jgi:hypothetical protein